MAEDLAGLAHEADDAQMATALRRLAQKHRIEALRLRSEFALASQEYDALYGVAPSP